MPQNVVIWEASAANLDKPKSVNLTLVYSSSVAKRMFSGWEENKTRINQMQLITNVTNALPKNNRDYSCLLWFGDMEKSQKILTLEISSFYQFL